MKPHYPNAEDEKKNMRTALRERIRDPANLLPPTSKKRGYTSNYLGEYNTLDTMVRKIPLNVEERRKAGVGKRQRKAESNTRVCTTFTIITLSNLIYI